MKIQENSEKIRGPPGGGGGVLRSYTRKVGRKITKHPVTNHQSKFSKLPLCQSCTVSHVETYASMATTSTTTSPPRLSMTLTSARMCSSSHSATYRRSLSAGRGSRPSPGQVCPRSRTTLLRLPTISLRTSLKLVQMTSGDFSI